MRLMMLGALVAVRCAATPTEVPLDKAFELPLGASARVTGSDQTVSFEQVESDSRCPAEAECVWAGNAPSKRLGHQRSDAPMPVWNWKCLLQNGRRSRQP